MNIQLSSYMIQAPTFLPQECLPVTDETDEKLLLDIAKNQNPESFKNLFNQYSPKLYRFAKSGRLSDSQARDLVQDVMTTIWTKAHLFNADKGKASVWIFTVARNARFDLYRKNLREGNHLVASDLWSLEDSPNLQDHSLNLEEQLQNHQLRQYVSQLSEQQKDVIEAVYFQGMTQEEYSQKHNLPLGTVKSRIRLAMQKLNKKMRSV